MLLQDENDRLRGELEKMRLNQAAQDKKIKEVGLLRLTIKRNKLALE